MRVLVRFSVPNVWLVMSANVYVYTDLCIGVCLRISWYWCACSLRVCLCVCVCVWTSVSETVARVWH